MLKRWLLLVLLSAPLLQPVPAQAQEFVVHDAGTRLIDDVYVLDADIGFEFSADVLEALQSGIPITISVDVEVERTGPWWWIDRDVASLEQRYQVHYYALANQYLLRNLNSRALYAYPNLNSVLDALGKIDALPLLDANLIEAEERHEVTLRARLDIESLPSPLRPLAYVSPAWRLSSDWFRCSLTQ
jgi:hypothetical protein